LKDALGISERLNLSGESYFLCHRKNPKFAIDHRWDSMLRKKMPSQISDIHCFNFQCHKFNCRPETPCEANLGHATEDMFQADDQGTKK